MLGWAVAAYSLFTILTPAAARCSVAVLCLCRVCLGLAEGVSLPCVHQLAAEWVPASERSRFITACTSGQFCGTLAAMSCAPMVQESWPLIFYLFGSLGLLWCMVWWKFGFSTPELHPGISEAELLHIRQRTQTASDPSTAERTIHTQRVPWRMFLHSAFAADVVAHFCHNWGSCAFALQCM